MSNTRTTQVALPGGPTADTARPAHPGAALGVAMLGFFVVALDSQVVNVACPASGRTSVVGWPACSGSSPATR
ncbi:protein of unknown function [Modestobacter italicus]|uniref:Uncharacterized protein n=1 Tax=Modestobacter italicus (strain DSM 44449 / CECT 9708 / BC 501) TaxID=2732864 RepID=I4EYS8_MODI5|nr:protein of unknown function [Modestobacter marinus]